MSDQAFDEHSCEHCGRTFVRPGTLLKHICEQKRRWLDKDRPSSRIGFNTWKQFYNKHHPSKKATEFKDFMTSHYYSAFVKFGRYCVDVGVVNPLAFSDYLIKNKVAIDFWTSDKNYTKYLIDYLKSEDCMDAVKRSIDTLLTLSSENNIQLSDSFRYLNTNRICQRIVSGHISPWVIYHSSTGQEFLSKLDVTQTHLIFDYIDPERWNIKFKREHSNVQEVKTLLKEIPL